MRKITVVYEYKIIIHILFYYIWSLVVGFALAFLDLVFVT